MLARRVGRLLGLTLLLAAAVAVQPARGQEKEPTYKGKTAGAWAALLKDKDPKVRRDAAIALWVIGPAAKAAVPALGDALKDKDAKVRAQAAAALGRIGVAAVPALIGGLKDMDDGVHGDACEALVEIGAAAVPALIDALKDKDDSTRRVLAASVLGGIGPAAKAAVPALIRALKDKNAVVRDQAAEALKKIDPEAAKKAECRDA